MTRVNCPSTLWQIALIVMVLLAIDIAIGMAFVAISPPLHLKDGMQIADLIFCCTLIAIAVAGTYSLVFSRYRPG